MVRTNSSSSAAAGAASATAAGITDKRAPTLYFTSNTFQITRDLAARTGVRANKNHDFCFGARPLDAPVHENFRLRYVQLTLLAGLILSRITINLIYYFAS